MVAGISTGGIEYDKIRYISLRGGLDLAPVLDHWFRDNPGFQYDVAGRRRDFRHSLGIYLNWGATRPSVPQHFN